MAHDGSESSVVAMLNGSISFDPELFSVKDGKWIFFGENFFNTIGHYVPYIMAIL